ncbi:hypothetical protein C8J57DRAFT_1514884 [Mycena rebaudengoi]|nr:hypothetical protein C8J57DRAFT_1514884 [Mycena rebaudengoi]
MSTPPTPAAPPLSTAVFPDRLANLILTSKTIVAAAELLPFPYVKGALGPVIPILEAVQKMAKNREEFTELCASIVQIITMLQEEISCHGADAASRLVQFCDQLKNLLLEIQQGLGKFQKPEKKGFRSHFREFGRSTSIGDELNKYKSRVQELRLNFITSSVTQLNIHARGSATHPPAPTAVCPPPCPPPSRIFQGRRDILDKMHQYFAQDIGKRHVCLLHGLGGSGKTQIALKFLDESQSDRFTDVFLLDASTAETIQAGLKNIALSRSLGSDHEEASRWLASSNTEWLLFFDNADDPKLNLFNFFPQSTCGNILITSRNPQLRVHAPGAHHQISDLEQEAAVQLLLASAAEPATSENEMHATQIVKVLYCFPLAVVQAGAYISKTRDLRSYIALYEQNHARLLSEVPVQSQDKYAWSVYTTWDISFKCLSKLAARFLQLCSFLHHEGISEAIFANAAVYSPELLNPTEEQAKEPRNFLDHFLTAAGMWDAISFSEMASEIQEYSLINKDPNTRLFSIHPLVHNWSKNTVSDIDATRECMAALLAMSVAWKDQVFTMRLLPHINAILQAAPQLATQFIYPYQRIYYDSGNYQQAQELCEDLLGQANYISGSWKLTDAEELEVVVLEKSKKLLGPEHPDTLIAMANLGATYRGLWKLTDAEALEVVVLEKRKKLLGPEHPDTLSAMANLGATYWGLGKLTDAEELGVVLLERRRQTLGPEHPHTLSTMLHLANTYQGLGKLTDAEELEVDVVDKSKKLLGTEHPDTLTAIAHLGATYRGLGKLTDAEELEVVILEKRKKLLGPEHPDTLTAMENLGATYWGLGKLTDAEELEVVVLEKRKKLLGPEHPRTLIAMENLGALQIVVEGRTQLLGTPHPDTVVVSVSSRSLPSSPILLPKGASKPAMYPHTVGRQTMTPHQLRVLVAD